MKRKLLFCSYLALSFIAFSSLVKADDEVCKSEERVRLSKLAFNINADYEPVLYALSPDEVAPSPGGEEQDALTYYRMMINIYNLDKDLRVEIYNKNENETYEFDYSSTKEGVLTLDAGIPTDINTYDIKIYGTSGCYSEFFRTITIITPKFNDMSTYEICSEIPDYELCKTFVTSDITLNDIEFNKKANEYKEKQKEKEKEDTDVPIIEFLKNNWKVITIVGTLVVVIGVTSTVIIVRKRRRRLV